MSAATTTSFAADEMAARLKGRTGHEKEKVLQFLIGLLAPDPGFREAYELTLSALGLADCAECRTGHPGHTMTCSRAPRHDNYPTAGAP